MKPIKILFSALIAICFARQAFGQNCADALSRAQANFENGQFQQAINEVKPCIADNMDKTEQWQIYKLMALSYLYLNDEGQARESAIKMLELNPTYKPNRLKEPKEFISLVESITVIPKFSLGVSFAGGINRTAAMPNGYYNVSSFSKNYTSGNGYQVGGFADYHFNKNIAAETGLFWSVKKYKFNYETSGFNISGDENLNYMEIPLCAKYTFGIKKIIPYISAGGFIGFLTGATNNISRTYITTNETTNQINLPSADRRNKTNYGLLGGAGIMAKLGPGSLILDYRYLYGMVNISSAEKRYANQELMYGYYYLDDDIMLRNSVFSVGYAYYLSYKVLQKR